MNIEQHTYPHNYPHPLPLPPLTSGIDLSYQTQSLRQGCNVNQALNDSTLVVTPLTLHKQIVTLSTVFFLNQRVVFEMNVWFYR